MHTFAKLVPITILGEGRVLLSYCIDPPVNLMLIDYKGPGGWVSLRCHSVLQSGPIDQQ